nr:IMP dehydrogenase [Armatimonadota bacterium]
MQLFREGLSFDDVLLIPKETRVLPSEVTTSPTFQPGIMLNVPIVSAVGADAPLSISVRAGWA